MFKRDTKYCVSTARFAILTIPFSSHFHKATLLSLSKLAVYCIYVNKNAAYCLFKNKGGYIKAF